MCTVLLPPGDNPITVNKYIISYQFEVSAAFSRPTYLTNVCHLWVFATWHEWSAAGSTSHCSVCHRLLSVHGKCHTGQRNHHSSLVSKARLVVAFPRLAYTWIVVTSSVVSNIQYVERGVLQYTNCGNNITMTRQTFDKCTRVQMFARHTSRGISIIIIITIY